MTTDEKPTRFLSRREVCDLVGVSYPSIWVWMREGKFPRSRLISDARVGWRSDEIEKWINDRPTQTLKGDKRKHKAA